MPQNQESAESCSHTLPNGKPNTRCEKDCVVCNTCGKLLHVVPSAGYGLEGVYEEESERDSRKFPFMFVLALFLMALINYVGGHFAAWWVGLPTGIIIGTLAVREADRARA